MTGENVDLARLKMVTELDTALHGETVARDQTPQEVWIDLLGKVRMMADTVKVMGRPHQSLENDIQHILNYWSADSDLNMPDYILAELMTKQLYLWKSAQEETAKWRGSDVE